MDDISLASPTHFRKKGKGLVNGVYKLCPTALYSVVQSRCSILSHDTFVWIAKTAVLKMVKES